mmetsp:Transcript_61564/g.165407  ORF Transcript_61564/g.165407 Transcript_61564/m.165407 type:complete len:225 (+) Transcript_61564:41-715(+)
MMTRFGADERDVLLEKGLRPADDEPELSFRWMFCQWFGVFVGGITFVAGSIFLFFPHAPNGGDWSAFLYTIGSLALLSVDLMEVFTFTNFWIRANSICSMLGSTLYLVGSIGFFTASRRLNIIPSAWCFIIGSVFAGGSQAWKTYRVSKGRTGRFHLASLFVEGFTELLSGAGVWCFFLGAVMYLVGPHRGAWYLDISVFWTGGSCFFLAGSFVLGFRLFAIYI